MDIDQLKILVAESVTASSNRHQLWRKILAEFRPKSICEIGVWKGGFAHGLLENIESIEEYLFVDPWRDLPNWNKPSNVSDDEFVDMANYACLTPRKIYSKPNA